MPEGVVLHIEERSFNWPAELVAKVAGVAVAPVRPRVAPPAWRGTTQRETCCEKGTVIVGELEPVVPFDARELGIGQTRPDIALARPGQPLGGFLAQPPRVTAVHWKTVAALAFRQHRLEGQPINVAGVHPWEVQWTATGSRITVTHPSTRRSGCNHEESSSDT